MAKTSFDYLNTKFCMGSKCLGFWVFLSIIIVFVFRSIIKKIYRFESNKNHDKDKIQNNKIYQVFPKYEKLEDFQDCCSKDEDKVSEAEFIINRSEYEFFHDSIRMSKFFEQPKILNLTVLQGIASFDNYDFERQELERVRYVVTEKVLELEADFVLDRCSVTEKLLDNQQRDHLVESVPKNSFENYGDEMDSSRQQPETTTEKESSIQILADVDLAQDIENTDNDNSDDVYTELEQKFSGSGEKISCKVDCNLVQDTLLENLVHDEPSLGEKQSKLKFNEDSDSEHDDIIEQLKMEIKNAKAEARKGGLPTISEDSEYDFPKILPELTPLKIDKKVGHRYRIAEIHKIYKSYADKMRKLDVLNLQTIHATGFAQHKASMQLTSSRKSGVLSLMFIKRRRPKAVTPMICNSGLKNDFEIVYVGQLCLSWEILRWQYQKALELREYDSHGIFHYNQVAGEFQLLQVLLQRFLENEPFQSQPRIENYVRSRSVLRSLLQVPVIIDDALRDKKRQNGGEEHAITISNLTDMIVKTMQLFWQFISTDNMVVNNPRRQTQADLQNPTDFELIMEIQNDRHKKEKKLKETMRCGSCIVKRFKKHEEEENGLMLFAQVELKLISRVLSMSKLTRDYLVWCHEKLHKINFCDRKIGIETSFFLFPC